LTQKSRRPGGPPGRRSDMSGERDLRSVTIFAWCRRQRLNLPRRAASEGSIEKEGDRAALDRGGDAHEFDEGEDQVSPGEHPQKRAGGGAEVEGYRGGREGEADEAVVEREARVRPRSVDEIQSTIAAWIASALARNWPSPEHSKGRMFHIESTSEPC
jgi:hypothetical protein